MTLEFSRNPVFTLSSPEFTLHQAGTCLQPVLAPGKGSVSPADVLGKPYSPSLSI